MNPTVLPSTSRKSEGIKGHHVLIAFLVFFGTIFAVNGVLLWKALATHSGLVANEPYRKGLHYNQRIAADAAQHALGWSDTVAITPSGETRISVSDRDGRPVTGLAVAAVIGRAVSASFDRKLDFAEREAGVYVANAGAIESGAWILNLEARRAGGEAAAEPDYRQRRKLWLKQ